MSKWIMKCTLALAALAAVLASASAIGQGWPQRAVKVVVPFVAGGNTDNQARIMSERVSALMGQPFVIENRVGAGGAIAAEYVAKAPADGYTLFFAASPLFSLPYVQKVNYDPFKDFAPISMIGTNAFVLGVHVSVPATTVKELVDYVKQRPGQLNYASGGTGSASHLAPALFLVRAGLKMTHIPYKGGAQAVADLVGGQVQMQIGNASELIQHSKSGKIRMLAVTSEKRTPQLPDLPAIAETYPGFRIITWNGYLAPAGTPKPIIDRLAQVIIKVAHEAATMVRLNNMGVDPLGNTPEEFADYVRRDDAVWRAAVNAAGIKLE
ncbi:MAG: tripartite tricarboxylate transporter substrate binding protein [Betaproteobacteria bacterium]|nr:tripartite tricarboxylate transporter substrate binding protein [Betaproteobacteria bacterium]